MAWDFNGSTGNIGPFTLNAAQQSLTTLSFGVWVWRDGPGELDYGRIASVQNAANDSDTVKLENDNGDAGFGLTFIRKWSTATGVWSVAYPTNGAWNHYLWTYDGGATTNDPICYKNGASVTVTDRVAPTGTLTNAAGDWTNLNLGNHNSEVVTWNGNLCEWAIWNRVLSATEAEAIGEGFSPLFYRSGLVFYVPGHGRRDPETDLMKGVTGDVTTGVAAIAHPRVIYPTGGL